MMKKNRHFLEKHSGSVSIISTMPTPLTRSSPRLSARLLVPQANIQDPATNSHDEVAVERHGITMSAKKRTSPRLRRSNSVPTKTPAETTTTEASNSSQAHLTRPPSAEPRRIAKEKDESSFPTSQPARAMERARSRPASKPKTFSLEGPTEETLQGSNDVPKTEELEMVAAVLEGSTEAVQPEASPVEESASDKQPLRLPKPLLSPRPQSQRQRQQPTKQVQSQVCKSNVMGKPCQKENLNENIDESNDKSSEVPISKQTERQVVETPSLRQRSLQEKGAQSPLTENLKAQIPKQVSHRQRDGSRQRTLRQLNS